MHRDGDSIRFGHHIPLTAAASGLALVRDETFLAVTNNHGMVLLDALVARDAHRDAVISTAHYGRDLQTVQVLESPDRQWLFASDEHNRTVSVLDLDRLISGATGADVLTCQIRVDLSPVGIALSIDGRYLYVACEMSRVPAPDLVNWFVWAATMHGNLRRAGVLSTIDLEKVSTDPERAVVANTVAGGHPVRVEHSHGHRVAWVTARASNQLKAFSTDKPEAPEPIATVPVGPAPVGLAVLEDLGVVLVANSNRFAATAQRETLCVVDMDLALTGQSAILGHIPVGSFPREIVVDDAGGVIYVSNFNSQSLSVINIESLRHATGTARANIAS
jgi:DNA-binding beta-propeller fold protein YncE